MSPNIKTRIFIFRRDTEVEVEIEGVFHAGCLANRENGQPTEPDVPESIEITSSTAAHDAHAQDGEPCFLAKYDEVTLYPEEVKEAEEALKKAALKGFEP